jgi:hypothetical protein
MQIANSVSAVSHEKRILEDVPKPRQSGTHVWLAFPEALLAHLTRRESATMAFSDALWMMSVLFFAALLPVPLIRRPAKPVQAATEAH